MCKSQTEAGIWSKKNKTKKNWGFIRIDFRKTSPNLRLDLCHVSNLQ